MRKPLWAVLLGAVCLAARPCGALPASPTCVAHPSNLAGWWPGDGDAKDYAGSNDGVLVGSVSFSAGMVDQAFLLNGTDAFVDVGNALDLHVSAGEFTVDAWVKFNALSHPPGSNGGGAPQGDMSIVDKMSGAGINTDGWRLIKQADNRFWFCLGGGALNHCGDPAFTVFSSTVATTGVWYHVTAVKTAAGIGIYVNGTLEDSRSPLPAFADTDSTDLLIGANAHDGALLNGLVDEAELFSKALSASEISSLVQADAAGKCKLTALSPAKVWIGLKNSDDVGVRFDLRAEVSKGASVLASGELDSVSGGSSGFNNAHLFSIPLSLSAPTGFGSGDTLRIRVSVRNACSGSGHNSGTARLWYNGQPIDSGTARDAGSRFDATIGGTDADEFLRGGLALDTTAGTSKLSIDVGAGSKCSAFKDFGTWSTTVH